MQEKNKLESIIISEYEKNPDININDLAKMVMPYLDYDIHNFIYGETKREIRRIFRRIKGEDGVRTYFSNGRGKIINVETTENINELNNVDNQITSKIVGLTKSKDKVLRRKTSVLDQITLFDTELRSITS